MTTTMLRDVLHDELDTLPVPAGDLAGVRRRGRRIRGARWAAAGAATVLVVGSVVAVSRLGGGRGDDRGIEPVGPLDYSHGLRAYADFAIEVDLGGRTFPWKDFEALDTDAAATPAGIVYYDHGVPLMLDSSGTSRELEPGAEEGKFSPTAKADSVQPWVAFGALLDGTPTVVVTDTDTGEEVARRVVGKDTVIDALDDSVVMLRTDAGTVAWDVTDGSVAQVGGGPDTRVADLRGGTLLFDGPRPDGPGAAAYRLMPGAIDAQLTLDGRHVLYWSPILKSTTGGDPIRLGLPRKAGWFTVDTDGSILAAASMRQGATIYDCPVSGAPCDELGTIEALHGDPMFIGNDM